MDFRALSQRYTEIYDGYTALTVVMPDFYDGGVLHARDMESLVKKIFQCSGIDELPEAEVQRVYDAYLDGVHCHLLTRMDAQISLYHATLLQKLHIRRTEVDPRIVESAEVQAQMSLPLLEGAIYKTADQIGRAWEEPVELKDKFLALKVDVSMMSENASRTQQLLDMEAMFGVGCRADIDMAEACLGFCHYDLAVLYLAQRNPALKEKIAGDVPIDAVYDVIRTRVMEFSTEGADAIYTAGDNIETAYADLAVSQDEFDAGHMHRRWEM